MQPDVICIERAYKADEFVDKVRRRPLVVGRGETQVSEAFAFRELALRHAYGVFDLCPVFLLRPAAPVRVEGQAVVADIRDAGIFIGFDFRKAQAPVCRIVMAVDGDRHAVHEKVALLPQVDDIDRITAGTGPDARRKFPELPLRILRASGDP